MFCPECGKKNKDEAKFCEYCGTKIVDDSPKEFKPVNKKKVDKKTKIIISIITGILIVLISSFMVISNSYKPTTIAKNYFEALMTNDSDRLYKYLSLKNSGLTSKKIYKEVTSNKKSTLKEYTGKSPIQFSSFPSGEIYCSSYLSRVIASFNS